MGGACEQGVMHWSMATDDVEWSADHLTALSEFAAAQIDVDAPGMARATYVALLASCSNSRGFVQTAGTVTFERTGSFAVAAPPAQQAAAGPSDVLVCSRALYGKTIIGGAWARHYLDHWGFAKLVVYQMGMNSGHADDRSVRALVEQGRVLIVDLRRELSRVYGPLFSDVVLHAHTGLALAHAHCHMLAHALGFAWVLRADFDEVLVGDVNAFASGLRGDAMALGVSVVASSHAVCRCPETTFDGANSNALSFEVEKLRLVRAAADNAACMGANASVVHGGPLDVSAHCPAATTTIKVARHASAVVVKAPCLMQPCAVVATGFVPMWWDAPAKHERPNVFARNVQVD